MAAIKIREMVEDDIPELAELYRLFWGEQSSVPDMHIGFNKLKNNADYIILSAVRNNCLVGSITGIKCYDLYGYCRPFMVIENFIVGPSCRRGGVGTSLFMELEGIARKKNCTQIILITENNRQDAINFYTKMGFDPEKNKGFKKEL